uniref:Sulfotransfer_1 domain-containing protein n=1 Tax=Panagrellus redivivus TaxID=6233 RepID=A0A7E4UQA7_PANRE
MICNAPAFKNLKHFTTLKPADSSVSTWIEAFAESECTSLKGFNVFDTSPSVFKIDKNVFLKFFKAQPDNFIMNFQMYEETKPDRVADVLKDLFGKHFERGEVDYSRKKKIINIRLKTNLRFGYTLRDD